ncbi:shikimate dehydrogenase [Colwellia sp. MEBiC06753]
MDKYAVFGHPISQSKSPFIHQQFAIQTHQDLEYTAIEPALDNFHQQITEFIKAGGKGCNVTMPFKGEAFEIADHISERAQLAQAVNTLTFNDDGTISADNTDGAGLVKDLIANGAPLTKRILLIGAGGAARGVIKPLLDKAPNQLVVTNRSFDKALALQTTFREFGHIEAVPLTELEHLTAFDLVINSTSTSLSGELPPVPQSIFAENGFAYDMVYQNKPTIFLAWAKQLGCSKTVDGLGMLVGQAAESFYLWRNVKPDQAQVLAMLRNMLRNH